MSSKPAEYVMFFSNYCNFSKDVICDITKKSLRDAFVFVCVDHAQHQLPGFVDRVPFVCNLGNKQCYVDADIDALLQSLRARVSTRIEQPFSYNECDSSDFECIPGGDSDAGAIVSDTNMLDLNMYRITCQNEDDNGKSGKNKASSSEMLDKYTAERERDQQRILATMHPA
jgi:hypothetical protein